VLDSVIRMPKVYTHRSLRDVEEVKSWLSPDWTKVLEKVSVVLKDITRIIISEMSKVA